MQIPHPVIIGCSGTALLPEEAALFQQYPPMGCILFARNILDAAQVKQLIAGIKTASGWNIPIWIDQEGGRVQRFRSPHWTNFPAMARFGALMADDAEKGSRLLDTATRLLAGELRDLGVDVDCHPVLDLRFPETHDVIGDRAFSANTEKVTQCGKIVIKALEDSGIVPMMKHFPGHGRARTDSHLELPIVSADKAAILNQDVAPFLALRATPMMMTAHIVYDAWDNLPATLSSTILHDFWRSEAGYDGLIVSDDLAMKALNDYGTPAELLQQTLTAGADLALYCSGEYSQNTAILSASPPITEAAWQRWQVCEAIRTRPYTPPAQALCAEYSAWAA